MKDWPGRVALTLAAFIGGGWATALVIGASPWTDAIDDTEASLLSTVGGVLAGAVATYLGASYEASRSERPGRPTGDEERARHGDESGQDPGPSG